MEALLQRWSVSLLHLVSLRELLAAYPHDFPGRFTRFGAHLGLPSPVSSRLDELIVDVHAACPRLLRPAPCASVTASLGAVGPLGRILVPLTAEGEPLTSCPFCPRTLAWHVRPLPGWLLLDAEGMVEAVVHRRVCLCCTGGAQRVFSLSTYTEKLPGGVKCVRFSAQSFAHPCACPSLSLRAVPLAHTSPAVVFAASRETAIDVRVLERFNYEFFYSQVSFWSFASALNELNDQRERIPTGSDRAALLHRHLHSERPRVDSKTLEKAVWLFDVRVFLWRNRCDALSTFDAGAGVDAMLEAVADQRGAVLIEEVHTHVRDVRSGALKCAENCGYQIGSDGGRKLKRSRCEVCVPSPWLYVLSYDSLPLQS